MTCYFCIILLKTNLKISLQEKSEGKTLTWRGCLVLASMSIATDEKRTDVETEGKKMPKWQQRALTSRKNPVHSWRVLKEKASISETYNRATYTL